MVTVQLVAVSLFALGIATMFFEGLVANHNANFIPPCPANLHCDYFPILTEFYFGLFPVIAGMIVLGVHKAMRERIVLDSPQP